MSQQLLTRQLCCCYSDMCVIFVHAVTVDFTRLNILVKMAGHVRSWLSMPTRSLACSLSGDVGGDIARDAVARTWHLEMAVSRCLLQIATPSSEVAVKVRAAISSGCAFGGGPM